MLASTGRSERDAHERPARSYVGPHRYDSCSQRIASSLVTNGAARLILVHPREHGPADRLDRLAGTNARRTSDQRMALRRGRSRGGTACSRYKRPLPPVSPGMHRRRRRLLHRQYRLQQYRAQHRYRRTKTGSGIRVDLRHSLGWTDKVRDDGICRQKRTNLLLHDVVGTRDPFVLAQVFRPRIDFERF